MAEPSYDRPWRREFDTRSSWGTHPAAHHAAKPQREYHIDDKGPSLNPQKEHAGDK